MESFNLNPVPMVQLGKKLPLGFVMLCGACNKRQTPWPGFVNPYNAQLIITH